MDSFLMNGYLWRVEEVSPNSSELIDRTGEKRLATTDPHTRCIYLSRKLQGDILNRVLLHELGHATMFSYGLINRLHVYVRPEYWIEAEEWICNFIADYGYEIFCTASNVLGEEAWIFIPYELERLIA